jgi:hypothetical protein
MNIIHIFGILLEWNQSGFNLYRTRKRLGRYQHKLLIAYIR